jgi:hypothetical protein
MTIIYRYLQDKTTESDTNSLLKFRELTDNKSVNINRKVVSVSAPLSHKEKIGKVSYHAQTNRNTFSTHGLFEQNRKSHELRAMCQSNPRK